MSSVPGNDKKTKLLVYTIEECPVCGQKTKRAFTVGDYITKDGAKCTEVLEPDQDQPSLRRELRSPHVRIIRPSSSSAMVCSN